MKIFRSEKNPIIKPEDIKPSRTDFKVIGVFNCGVTKFKDETLLLMRVAETPMGNNPDNEMESIPFLDIASGRVNIKKFNKKDPEVDFSDPRIIRTPYGYYLSSISHFRIARSRNGIDFETDIKPAMFPENKYERFGLEDPRITKIGQVYYIAYSAVSDMTGVTVCLASTTDFITFVRHGVIFEPDNKNVAIFPEKIDGKYYALSRPESSVFAVRGMWISESENLINWGNHMWLMGIRKDRWDDGRIGCGAAPFRIKEGWLEIYHGATKENRYCLGAVLLDADKPFKIIARSKKPIMEPEMDYELNGFFGNVIFTCGVLFEQGIVKIYYGAADTHIAYAEAKLEDIKNELL